MKTTKNKYRLSDMPVEIGDYYLDRYFRLVYVDCDHQKQFANHQKYPYNAPYPTYRRIRVAKTP